MGGGVCYASSRTGFMDMPKKGASVEAEDIRSGVWWEYNGQALHNEGWAGYGPLRDFIFSALLQDHLIVPVRNYGPPDCDSSCLYIDAVRAESHDLWGAKAQAHS